MASEQTLTMSKNVEVSQVSPKLARVEMRAVSTLAAAGIVLKKPPHGIAEDRAKLVQDNGSKSVGRPDKPGIRVWMRPF
jgi:hypothetical protein